MIRHKTKKTKLYSSEKDIATTQHKSKEQIFFSDTSGAPNALHRFIGQGNSAIVTNGMEDAFLQVACTINAPTLVSKITATIKQPDTSFEDIAFDLIKVSSSNGPINIVGDSIVLSVSIPSSEVFHKHAIYSESTTFSPIMLKEGDLIAVRIDPSKNNKAAFYAAVTIH